MIRVDDEEHQRRVGSLKFVAAIFLCVSLFLVIFYSIQVGNQLSEIRAAVFPGPTCEILEVVGSQTPSCFHVSFRDVSTSLIHSQRVVWDTYWTPYSFEPNTVVDCYGEELIVVWPRNSVDLTSICMLIVGIILLVLGCCMCIGVAGVKPSGYSSVT